MIQKILIAVNESVYAENAAKFGFKLAKDLGAQVGLVSILQQTALPAIDNGASEILGTPFKNLDPENPALLNVEIEVAENTLANIEKKYAGDLRVTHIKDFGETGEGIIGSANEFKADLIVLGTHNRSGLDRIFSSNISEYVVNHSNIPVLVVPTVE